MIILQLRHHFSTLIHEIHTLSTIFIDFNLISKTHKNLQQTDQSLQNYILKIIEG
jgi:hypothetical protein